MSPWATFPSVAANRSQMDSPRPSAFVAPSIWNAAVAAPQTNLPLSVIPSQPLS